MEPVYDPSLPSVMTRLLAFLTSLFLSYHAVAENGKPAVMLVIHGGAGTITRGSMTAELEGEYRAALAAALSAGHEILIRGGTSLDAVEAAVRLLEDSPLFNAGRGSVFTHEGRNELDASIMEGATRCAGAVASVTTIKNPVSAARAVMEKTPHVMLVASGAEQFAESIGLDVVEPGYFWTPRQWSHYLEERRRQEPRRDSSPPPGKDGTGTVGAVALDARGNLAAATSTGGMSLKRFGRVGDSPIIGAGTWADNATCAVSATGHGEYFIRATVARDIAALMEYRGKTVQDAAREVIDEKLRSAGGSGGVIALDAAGRFAMVFTTKGMYRGHIAADGIPHILIYGD